MYEFWDNYVIPKYSKKSKFCYMDTDSFIVYIKTHDIYGLDRPLPKGKNEKVIGLMKYKLGRQIMTKFVTLRAKAFSYLVDDSLEDKKPKDTKTYVIKRKPKFENHKSCLEATQLEIKTNYLEKNKIVKDSFFCYRKKHKEFIRDNKLISKTQQRFKSERHNVFAEEINKIALSSNDDKRMQLG